MKKIILLLLGFIPMFSFAGVIMTTNGERIEDVSIQNETDSAIVYMQDSVEKSIAIEQVSAILYDNGTYKEIYQPKAMSLSNSFSSDTITHVVPDSLKITSMFGLALNPDVMKLAFDPAFAPAFAQYSKSVWEEAQIEYELIFLSEIAKGNSKKNAKKIAKQVRDSINTVKLMEYVSLYSTK